MITRNPLRTRATLIGAVAVLMWSSLAPLTASTKGIPPMQLLAVTFGIAFLCGSAWLLMTGGWPSLRRLQQPLPYLAFATAALFGYHALYFVALSLAPAAQASLIAYLWPLLIVLFAALGSRTEPIRLAHVVGALLGFAGTALLILSRDAGETAAHNRPLGLLAALCCAVIWSSYSVLNRRFRDVPSEAMIGVCGLVSILGWVAHAIFDSHTAPATASQWVAIVALGFGPVGLAFLAWDYGTKRGNLGLLGPISYAAPVLSTLLLVTFGYTRGSMNLLAACALVVGGAWIATASGRTDHQEPQQ
jgi:drug/metabolite transporter (DMT)-like permease